MDSRDIKENPEIIDHFLNGIFKLQKELLESYIKIEDLPPYPININKKTNQFLLKDITSRVIEELAEGYESLNQVWALTKLNKYWVGDYTDETYLSMLNHLQNFGEELADALHFFTELLIYINIDVDDIEKYMGLNQPSITGPSVLEYALEVGYSNIIKTYRPEIPNKINQVFLLENFTKGDEGIFGDICGLDIRYYNAGRYISEESLELQKKLLWDITYHLNISRNFLKNKPWKQSEEMTAETQYQTEVMKAFISFMGYLRYVGLRGEDVYFLYFKKNKVNQFRIKSNY